MRKVSPGIFLSEEILQQAGIGDEARIEVLENLIRITPSDGRGHKGMLSRDSPIWDQVMMGSPDEQE